VTDITEPLLDILELVVMRNVFDAGYKVRVVGLLLGNSRQEPRRGIAPGYRMRETRLYCNLTDAGHCRPRRVRLKCVCRYATIDPMRHLP
jgi:hypothetical protein